MKSLLLAAALAALPALAMAQVAPSNPAETGLSQPVIALTGVLAKNADALGLDDSQKAAVKAWVGEMPAKRQAAEAEAVEMRTRMRQMIAAGAPVAEREALARQIGEAETALIMMRSNCTDHWREVLTPDQFAALLRMAKVTE